MTTEKVKLTEFSHGAGCGCKIAPNILDSILSGPSSSFNSDKLIVGNEGREDASAYDLGDGTALLSTIDFFMPIVDDAYDFGRIAATNAISDIYAMGGQPFLATSVLAWPIGKISENIAREVIEGAKDVCRNAKVALAGGHSIDNPEPIFGLAVNGRVKKNNLKRNGGSKGGDSIFLTKPLGIGIISTAKKKNLVKDLDYKLAIEMMLELNSLGAEVASFGEVTALTDVTGFGLLGHLKEMMDTSNLTATIDYDLIPLLPNLEYYISKGCTPGGTTRNFTSYGNHIYGLDSEIKKSILCDPQTSGGLLITVETNFEEKLSELARSNNSQLFKIGSCKSRSNYAVEVR